MARLRWLQTDTVDCSCGGALIDLSSYMESDTYLLLNVAADYYAQSPSRDPRGPEQGEKRVIRGGSWKSAEEECRVTSRLADDPGISDACFARDTFGFRCVRRLNDEELGSLATPEGP